MKSCKVDSSLNTEHSGVFSVNILFLTMSGIVNLEQKGIYTDLLREFVKNSHNVTVATPVQKKFNEETNLKQYDGYRVLRVKIGNTQKTNVIKKGINTVLLEGKFMSAIKQYCSDTKFDLIIYSTPPITFAKVINYIKRRDGAKTYLLLKDIFPQNAVDIGMMRKSGFKGIIYRYFRMVEKKLYKISDYIGCMSEANVDYVLKHNPEVSPETVEVCPNSIEVQDLPVTDNECVAIREKYGIPADIKVFIYGGNLGKPQGIPFLMKCLKTVQEKENAFFLVVGDGTEYGKLEKFFAEENLPNARLLKKLPKEDYDRLVSACDVGLIFLDHRFTIPNFPSRLLAYMQKKMPVIACTDPNTDIGKVVFENGFGWWCESNDAEKFADVIDVSLGSDLKSMGEAGYEFLKENYTVSKSYTTIMKRM